MKKIFLTAMLFSTIIAGKAQKNVSADILKTEAAQSIQMKYDA